MRAWSHLVGAVVVVAAIGAYAVLRTAGLDDSLFWTGLVFLAMAAFLWFWDFEKDALFADDWVEVAQVTASVVSLFAGVAFLAVHFII